MRIYTIFKNIIKKIQANVNVERITEEQIDDIFGSASGTGTNAQDYVVEHGASVSSDNVTWKYEKWASGKAICRCQKTFTLDITTRWGSGVPLYYSGGSTSNYVWADYPSGLFNNTPRSFTDIRYAGASCFLMTVGSSEVGSKDRSPSYHAVRASSLSGVNVVVAFLAIGTWK